MSDSHPITPFPTNHIAPTHPGWTGSILGFEYMQVAWSSSKVKVKGPTAAWLVWVASIEWSGRLKIANDCETRNEETIPPP